MTKLDLTDKKFGRWTVIKLGSPQKTSFGQAKRMWKCKCDCGTLREVRSINLTSGRSQSCGCINTDRNKKLLLEKAPNWKGGRHIDDSGYVQVYIPKHPRAKKNGYVREHIVVMENSLGRALYPDENVHHLNGVKDDNRPENLELWSTSQPCGQRAIDKVIWAKEILKRYGKEINLL